MREGWTYKKLGEVCDLYQPKTISSDMLVSDGDYPVYGANGIIGRYNQYNHEDTEVLVTCRGATCGTINVSTPFSWINGNAMVIHPKNESLSKNYLSYALRGIDLSDVITGAAQPQITRQSLSPTIIPLPPLSEQQRIVSELDLLSSIIEKKKAQLKEYDQLAQSIFYDMFGSTNDEKGWEVKKFGEVGTFQRGGGFLKSDFVEKGFPCIHYGQIHTKFGFYTYNNLTSISKELAISKSRIAHKGDVIIAITSEDVEGSCKSVAWMGDYDVAIGAHAAIFSHNQNPIYVSYYFRSAEYNRAKERYARGFKVVEIKPDDIAKIDIPLPPLSLQQSFAEKIEAIERQKALVQQSITETETLFNSRMDYWFS